MAVAPRPGEVALPFDPAEAGALTLLPIGRVRSPWSRGNCPRNLREARESGGDFTLEIDLAFRPGLQGLSPGDPVILLYWTSDARRDLVVQSPAHRSGPAGVFALRSPARPNPVAVAVTRITTLDAGAGRVGVEAIDAFDGTALLDIKPFLASVDQPPPG